MGEGTIERLTNVYGLNRRQAKFVVELVKNGGNKTAAHKAAGYKGTDAGHCANAIRLLNNDRVNQAYRALARETEPGATVEELKLSKGRLVEDLELAKIKALDNINEGRGGGGAYTGYVKATELQGRAIGMFNVQHHHRHEHAAIPTDELIKRLRGTNPELAVALAEHLDVEVEE